MASAACHAYQRVIASVDFRLCPVRRLIKDTTGAGSYPQPPLAVVDGKGYVANMERVDDAPLCQGWLPSVCLVGKDGFQQMVVQPARGIGHKQALAGIEAKYSIEVVQP